MIILQLCLDTRQTPFVLEVTGGTGSNKSISCYCDTIIQSSVDADKTILLDSYMTRNNCMRSNKSMVCDGAVMPEMVSTPHNYIVAYSSKRLYDIVFKDEAVFADRRSIVKEPLT